MSNILTAEVKRISDAILSDAHLFLPFFETSFRFSIPFVREMVVSVEVAFSKRHARDGRRTVFCVRSISMTGDGYWVARRLCVEPCVYLASGVEYASGVDYLGLRVPCVIQVHEKFCHVE